MQFKFIFIVLAFTLQVGALAQSDTDTARAHVPASDSLAEARNQKRILSSTETYTIKKTSFSSDNFAEFSPVYYKDKLVFCTDRNKGVSNYSTSDNAKFFNIYYVDTLEVGKKKKVKPFAKELNTKLNDGPVSFNAAGDTIFFSRNIIVDGSLSKLSSTQNKLGIFSAVLENGHWKRVTEFRFNNEWNHVTTPCISPDGKRLYFATDRFDGYGGSDLWYSDLKEGFWDLPVNMGPVINTPGNEAYPFMTPAGELLFSSDGHPGLGKKDIFISKHSGNAWLKPVALDPPINSEHEDFGIVTNRLVDEGYFSSNRGKSPDIYRFKMNFPQIFFPVLQRENQYCFRFSDPGFIETDSLKLSFQWNFGDGKSASGSEVWHCFPGPGKYDVKLDLIERESGNRYFNKLSFTLVLKAVEQPFINAPLTVMAGEKTWIDGLQSNLPGYNILNYFWDFGDGIRTSGNIVEHTFDKAGEYTVNLALIVRNDSTGTLEKMTVAKQIGVFATISEWDRYLTQQAAEKKELPEVKTSGNKLNNSFSAESVFREGAVFTIELAKSTKRLDMRGQTFRRLPAKYTLRERFVAADSTWRYTVEQQTGLMGCYPGYSELVKSGFPDAEVTIRPLDSPAEKELLNLMKVYGTSADLYFDSYEGLTTSAYIMLDQVAQILNKYPKTKIEVAVHSDPEANAAITLAKTQRRSQTIVNYLVNKGIENRLLVTAGYGITKPIAPNNSIKNRKINRRIEFVILD